MSSNGDAAFGMDEDVRDLVERDLAGQGGGVVGDVDEPVVVQAAKKPPEKSWIERNLFLVIGGVVAFFVLITVITLVVKSTGRGNAERAAEAQRRAQLVNEERQAGAIRNEVAALQAEMEQVKSLLKSQGERLDKLSGNQDMASVDQRVTEAQRQLQLLGQDMQHLRKVVADQQPLETEMLIRGDVEIVSVGNGLARIRDRNGVERTLRKGDRWDGVRVMSIRADRRQVTLSDGSVIL